MKVLSQFITIVKNKLKKENAETQTPERDLGRASKCVWELDKEA